MALFSKVFAFALLMVFVTHAAFAGERVTMARLNTHEDRTRFVLDLTGDVSVRVFSLPDPARVVIDLTNATWTTPTPPLSNALVQRVRHAMFDPQTLRIVLDAEKPVTVLSHISLPDLQSGGRKIVVDLQEKAPKLPLQQPATTTTTTTPPLPPHGTTPPSTPVKTFPLPPATKPAGPRVALRPVIVIDPGHGGTDPGATAVDGTYEKVITLAMAKQLKQALDATGRYRVVLTRNKDIFIRLRDRVRVAHNEKASLFISLHADSIAKPDVRGLSIYTLSDKASDREAAMLADSENKVDTLGGVSVEATDGDVLSILIDLAQRDTMNQSRRFSNIFIDTVQNNILLLDKPARSAGFAVLTAPDIPSALIEMGYLSNPNDASLLMSPDHQKKLTTRIAKAIDAFFQPR